MVSAPVSWTEHPPPLHTLVQGSSHLGKVLKCLLTAISASRFMSSNPFFKTQMVFSIRNDDCVVLLSMAPLCHQDVVQIQQFTNMIWSQGTSGSSFPTPDSHGFQKTQRFLLVLSFLCSHPSSPGQFLPLLRSRLDNLLKTISFLTP